MDNQNRISFHFHPYNFENKGHVVEKANPDGVKKRHIEGISSGIKQDEHGERMTQNCINGFMEQANSGDVLLYPDIHGIKASEDIGKLSEAKILPTGDWWTDYVLYDIDDGIGERKAEMIDTIWKQLCGLPPYSKAKQKGFSIEGYIPPDGILSGEMDAQGNVKKRIINSVLLDGVILVPRPAYADSIATAVYKALGELPPEFASNLKKSIQGELQSRIKKEELNNGYYRNKWDIQDALDSQVEKIMQRANDPRKAEQLDILFQEYKSLMINLIMGSEALFIKDELSDVVEPMPYGTAVATEERINPKIELFKSILVQLKTVQKTINQRS